MQEIYSEELAKILKNKNKLESELNVNITNKGKNIFVDGEAPNEFTALQIIEAINVGFSVENALLLKDEENMLQILHIKDITKRHDLDEVRARIIGTKGKTLKTLLNLTDCHFSLHDNNVGIIGHSDNMEDAVQAIESIVHGSKQSNVYARLEKQKKRKRIQGKLGLNLEKV